MKFRGEGGEKGERKGRRKEDENGSERDLSPVGLRISLGSVRFFGPVSSASVFPKPQAQGPPPLSVPVGSAQGPFEH